MKRKSLNVKKINHSKILLFLTDPKIKKIYSVFKKNISDLKKTKDYSAAISGGPDSLSLAFLLKCYSIETSKKVQYYHVDHGLRKNSGIEAQNAKLILKKLNINLNILKWFGKKPKSNLQSTARKKRYDLIYKSMSINKINILFFGHNLDDLIENFFLRLTRGSGLDGIVSFNSKITINEKGMLIVRPLINIEKEDLLYITKKVFGYYIQDISNNNINFKRVRIRNIITKLKDEGFDYTKIKLTTSNLTDANLSLRYYVNENIKNNSSYINHHKIILSKEFFNQPNEIVFRSLKHTFLCLNNNYYAPRGKKIINLIKTLKNGNFRKTTLGGCIVEKFHKSVLVFKENSKKNAKYV